MEAPTCRGEADRIESFQRENLLRLQDLLQEYFIVATKWIWASRPGGYDAEPFQRLRVSLDDCRSRSTDEKLRSLIHTLVRVEVDKTTTDYETLGTAYIAPCATIRKRIDELLQTTKL